MFFNIIRHTFYKDCIIWMPIFLTTLFNHKYKNFISFQMFFYKFYVSFFMTFGMVLICYTPVAITHSYVKSFAIIFYYFQLIINIHFKHLCYYLFLTKSISSIEGIALIAPRLDTQIDAAAFANEA